jgi:RNA polymerase sigma-70 factor (ECF subfamily)
MDESTPVVNRSVRPVPADAADVALAQSGDHQAFERLYRANLGRVHALVWRMAGPDRADELTQDVFVRAWEKLGSFRGEAAFATWLHRVAVNLLLSRRAKLRREREMLDEDDGILEHRSSGAPRPELVMDLETAVSRLPEGARQVFVLHDVEGYRHEEVADAMGIAVGTSKAQLHRARMLLRGHLEPRTKDGM